MKTVNTMISSSKIDPTMSRIGRVSALDDLEPTSATVPNITPYG